MARQTKRRGTPGTVLVTGAAGFIGYHVATRLLADGRPVLGVDNLNPYYDVSLKQARLARLREHAGFRFSETDLADRAGIESLFAEEKPRLVINLAAQAGVRYSLSHPHVYVDSNVTGFLNILEGCRHAGVSHLVYASSSSVYGGNTRMPFAADQPVDHPLSLYAATKKANELMAHAYSHLYRLPTTGLRFFTVYGPWGRPDMALFIFTKAILAGEPIEVFNRGRMKRDLTYIDDVVDGVVGVLDKPATADLSWTGDAPDPATSSAPFRLHNIGGTSPVELMRVIDLLEEALDRKAKRKLMPMQPGDVPETYADVSSLEAATGFTPSVSIEAGIPRFVEWYREFYGA